MFRKIGPPQVPDGVARRAIVTGANRGLGRQVAYALAASGAEVTLACRDLAAAEATAAAIRTRFSRSTVRALRLDLGDLESVQTFADTVRSEAEPLDLLVNNAGIRSPTLQHTRDGFELHLGTNHLGHFALTGLLLQELERAVAARVVVVSSDAHMDGTLDVSDLHFEHRTYHPWAAYAQSKLANHLFTAELHRMLTATESSVTAVAADPGWVFTGMQKADGMFAYLRSAIQARPPSRGAVPLLRAATADDVEGGKCYGHDSDRGDPLNVNAELATLLWKISVEATRVSYS